MLYIDCAGFLVELDNKYQRIERYSRRFTVEPGGREADISLALTKADFELEKTISPDASNEQLEALAFLRILAHKLPKNDAFLFHSVMLEYDDNAYAFAARSGTGKSTHARMWGEVLGDELSIICGDKAIVRIIDGKVYGGGTPWNGKEGWGEGGLAPLKSCGFIERAENGETYVSEMKKSDAFMRMMAQTLIPREREAADKFMSLMDTFISQVDFYKIVCDISKEAAVKSIEALSGKKLEL